MIIISKSEKSTNEIIENWQKQLRKGLLELALLSYIERRSDKTYGYELIKIMREENIKVDSNTIYPILRRLEKSNLIQSIWKTENDKPRKFFNITAKGLIILTETRNKWLLFDKNIRKFIIKGD